MSCARSFRLWLVLPVAFLLLALGPAASAIDIDWVTVADRGNACDPQRADCFESVAAPCRISKFEVNNAQYAEFSNAVAATDTNALYNTSMGSGFGGITHGGVARSFTYAAIGGRDRRLADRR